MTTRYEKELSAWIAQRQRTEKLPRSYSVSVFLGVRPYVIEARAAGFSLKDIWSHLRDTGRIQIRYETFLRYVRRYITERGSQEPL